MNPFPSSSPAARILTEIRREAGPLRLVAGPPRPSRAADGLSRLSDEEILGSAPSDRGMAAALRAGLLLLADRMEESHALSQGIETPEGSYWHGILHRREPDYSNARYWFRRVGSHPLHEKIGAGAKAPSGLLEEIIRGGRWDPLAFVDLCEESAAGKRRGIEPALEELEMREIEELLAYCFEGATGGRRSPDRS